MENEYLTINEHKEFCKRMEEEDDRQNHRLASMEETLNKLLAMSASVERLATNMEHMCQEQAKQGERLDALESRDGEMWRTMISHILVLIVGGVVGFMLKNIGL